MVCKLALSLTPSPIYFSHSVFQFRGAEPHLVWSTLKIGGFFFTFLIKADSLVPGRVPVLDGLWEGMMEAPPPWAEIPLLPHVLWGPRDGGRGQELQRTSVWGTGL